MSDAPADLDVSSPTPRRRLGRVLVGLLLTVLALIVVVLGTFTALSSARANETYPLVPVALEVPEGADAIAAGRRLAVARGCVDCHGDRLQGGVPLDAPPLGRFVAPNLTAGAGGTLDGWSDEDIARVILYGVRNDGSPALFMPAHEYFRMPTDEVEAIVAYIRASPPIDHDLGASSIRPLGRILHVTDGMAIYPAERVEQVARTEEPIDPSDPVELGSYLADGCIGCHGDGLSGGKIPGSPPSLPIPTNITPHDTGLAGWTAEQFRAAMQTGVRPDGTTLDPFMPYRAYAAMTDAEVDALWLHLQGVPPRPFGER